VRILWATPRSRANHPSTTFHCPKVSIALHYSTYLRTSNGSITPPYECLSRLLSLHTREHRNVSPRTMPPRHLLQKILDCRARRYLDVWTSAQLIKTVAFDYVKWSIDAIPTQCCSDPTTYLLDSRTCLDLNAQPSMRISQLLYQKFHAKHGSARSRSDRYAQNRNSVDVGLRG
jgi:hypothetical protein